MENLTFDADPEEVVKLLESPYYRGFVCADVERFTHEHVAEVVQAMIISHEYVRDHPESYAKPIVRIHFFDCSMDEEDFLYFVSQLPKTRIRDLKMAEMRTIQESVIQRLIEVLPLLKLYAFEFSTDGVHPEMREADVYVAALQAKTTCLRMLDMHTEAAVRKVLYAMQTTEHRVTYLEFCCSEMPMTSSFFEDFIEFVRNNPQITRYKLYKLHYNELQTDVLTKTMEVCKKQFRMIENWYDEPDDD